MPVSTQGSLPVAATGFLGAPEEGLRKFSTPSALSAWQLSIRLYYYLVRHRRIADTDDFNVRFYFAHKQDTEQTERATGLELLQRNALQISTE